MSSNWSKGYVADITYSHGYYHELAPPFIRFFLLMNGYANAQSAQPYRYCELGYGQGVSCNIHAAANPRGRFCGTDFHPDHALFAQRLAAKAGLEAQWLATGFEQMPDEPLPMLDVICLHGVWSWVDSAARHAIVEFIRRRLKVGGVVYLSYNVMPGWHAEMPLRDLLCLHAERAGAAGAPTPRKIHGALEFAQRLRQAKAGYFEHNARAGQMLDDMQRDEVHVVAHEYFNRSWFITYFADLARDLEGASLSFACSLHRSDLTGEVFRRTQPMQLGELDPVLRQTTHDFVLNRRFRRDVFVRGALRLADSEREERLRQVRLVLLRPAATISPQLQTPYGTVQLDAGITARVAARLGASEAGMSMGDLLKDSSLADRPVERVFEAIAALVAQSQLAPVFDDDAACMAAPDARRRLNALNRAIARQARHDNTLRYLASPVTGQGMEATRTERRYLDAWHEGARTAQELAAAGAGRAAPASAEDATPDENANQVAQAERFIDTVLPLWRRLGLMEMPS